MRFLVPAGQRPYVASHPLGVFLSLGIAVSGWVNLIFPNIGSETSSSIVFGEWILLAFNLAWAFGGSISVFGLLRGKAKVEGAGMSLLAGALGAYYAAIVGIRIEAAVTAVFILFLSVGCALRAYHLATHAYVNLDVPHKVPGQ